MHIRWKWQLALVAVGSLTLLIGGVLTLTRGDANRNAPIDFRVRPIEAAVSTSSRVKAWPAWTNPGTKIVPILSAGTPGIRLGFAQVSGAKTLVSRVRAVLQIDADFNGVRAKLLVPSDSLTDLRRVQGTAVTAVLQYQLMSFKHDSKDKAAAYRTADRCEHHDNGRHLGWCKHCKKTKKGGPR